MLRYIDSLEKQVKALEKEYDALNEEMAKGANSDYDAKSDTKCLKSICTVNTLNITAF